MKIPSTLLRLAIVIAAAAPVRAQLRQEWLAMYATPGNDYATAVVTDSAGNVHAAGYSNIDATGVDGSAFVAAWDASGAPLWSRTFDSSLGHIERPTAMAFDGVGGLYVVGAARGPTNSQYATFVLHLDAAGVITWSVEQPLTADGLGGAVRPALVVDAQGRAIVGDRGPSGSGDFEITAYTLAGAVAWQTTYAGSAGGVDRVVDLALAPNGEIVAVGNANSASASAPGSVPTLLRLASDGTLLQALEITTEVAPFGFANDVAVDAQGRIFVVATQVPATWSIGIRSIVLLAYDAQGVFDWARTINGPPQFVFGGAWAHSVKVDVFGRAVVMGWRSQGANVGHALLLAAYEVNGDQAWQSVANDPLGGPTTVDWWVNGSDVLLDPSGEAIVVGQYFIVDLLENPPHTRSDTFAYAVDAPGKKRFGNNYAFPPMTDSSNDGAAAGALAGGGAIVLAGFAHTAVGLLGDDAYVARFSRTAGGFCFGDSSLIACPCGNASEPVERAGCTSSLGVGGRLADLGTSSLSSDTLKLVGTSMPNSVTVYYQGTHAADGAPFGDGLLCVRGSIVRLGEKFNVAGTSQFPGSGDLPISVIGQVSGPGMRAYQAVYRNGAAFCTNKTFNSTNGLQVSWGL